MKILEAIIPEKVRVTHAGLEVINIKNIILQ